MQAESNKTHTKFLAQLKIRRRFSNTAPLLVGLQSETFWAWAAVSLFKNDGIY